MLPARARLPVGGIALWHRSRQKRGHRDSVTNKTIGAICSPQECVYCGSVAKKIGARSALRKELSIKKYSSSRQMSTTSVRDEEFFHVLPPCLGKTQFCPAHFP